MTLPDIGQRIAEYDWYQRIPLGGGAVTPGEDTFTERKLPLLGIPENLVGRSVLDIGCSEGYYARESEGRGAGPVVGIDNARFLAAKNGLLNEITGSRFDFREGGVDDLSAEAMGVFDLVIFLSVFQHLDHPYFGLERIAEVTRVTAIMEIPVAVAEADDEQFQREPVSIMRRSDRGRRILLPNEAMLGEMLYDAGFSAIDRRTRHRPRIVPGYDGRFRQERLILHAHRGTERL